MGRQQLLDFDNLAHREPIELLSPDDIFEQASQDLLCRLSEDNRLERKPAREHAAVIAEYLSMWANTPADGGLIVCGMANEGGFPGCKSLNATQLNNLEGAGRTHCPDAKYRTKRVRVINQVGDVDYVVLFRVYYHESKVVETNTGNAYHRRGESKCKLTDEEKHELSIDKGQVSVELEPSGLRFPDDFDLEAVRRFTTAVRLKKDIGEDITDKQILVNHRLAKLLGDEFVPNIACALLFAKDPRKAVPGCMIRFLKFQGEHEMTGADRNVVKDETFEGQIPDLIVQADKYIDAQIRDFSSLGSDGRFYTQPEYPREAWYEAVVNACVHRSYSLKGMNIFIKMFDNRLVVESPGGFMPFVTPENIYDCHYRRNAFLMEAMMYLRFVKCEHEGTRRMRNEMEKLKLPAPEFEEKDANGVNVRVTLRNNVKQRKAWVDAEAAKLIVGEAVFSSLEEKERQALNFVAEYKKITVTQAARVTKSKWQTAKKLLERLKEREWLDRKHSKSRDCKSYYFLKGRDPGDS